MKARVRLGYTVELVVEGRDEEAIQEWLNSTTPEQAMELSEGMAREDYIDEILSPVAENSSVDYCISRPKSLLAIIASNGGAPYICTSFEEAANNGRDRNIVIIDDADIYFTCKRNGVFGELVCWVEDEFKEEPELFDIVESFLAQYLDDSWYIPEKDVSFAPYEQYEQERD